MRRVLLGVGLIFVLIAVSGCIKGKQVTDSLLLAPDKVKESVKGWRVYTNPAFRYELRHPQEWRMETSGEDGKQVQFFISEKSTLRALVIKGFSNWQENLKLQDFFAKQEENLLALSVPQEQVTVAGGRGIWFKGVEKEGVPINVIVLSHEDRILVVELWTDWEQSLVVLNSFKFYPNKVNSELK